MEKECVICGNTFVTYPSDDCDTCSTECGYELVSQKTRNDKKKCAASDCDDMFHSSQPDVKFCSPECAYGNRATDEKTRVELECENCGELYELPPYEAERSRFCSVQCKDENRETEYKGNKNPAWNSIELDCNYCGDSYFVKESRKDESRFCTRECYAKWLSKNLTGDDNPSFNPEYVAEYGDNWREMRDRALERDDEQCIVCGRGKDEIGRQPDVHHVKPISEFEDPGDANFLRNLVVLCRKHHVLAEKWNLAPANRVT